MEFIHARGADLSIAIEEVLKDLISINGDDSSTLVMCARNENRDQPLADSICRGHPQIKVQSVASSAGHLNRKPLNNYNHLGHTSIDNQVI